MKKSFITSGPDLNPSVRILGPVVQNFVSLMLLLSPQFVNYILTSKTSKGVILPFEILTNR